jgi:hypothetical protein
VVLDRSRRRETFRSIRAVQVLIIVSAVAALPRPATAAAKWRQRTAGDPAVNTANNSAFFRGFTDPAQSEESQ